MEKSPYMSYTQMRFKLDLSNGQEYSELKYIDKDWLNI